MGCLMVWNVDGGCRGNGQQSAIGAAAAVLERRWRGPKIWTRQLPQHPNGLRVTNQRAEIAAIILALELTLQRYGELDGWKPYITTIIKSDSRYAIDCMTMWIAKWTSNGWTNAAGNEVVNRNLIEYASKLDDEVAQLGSVEYRWVSREDNDQADQACNIAMDDISKEATTEKSRGALEWSDEEECYEWQTSL